MYLILQYVFCFFSPESTLYGPLHSQKGTELYKNAVSEAVKQGGKIECGGKVSMGYMIWDVLSEKGPYHHLWATYLHIIQIRSHTVFCKAKSHHLLLLIRQCSFWSNGGCTRLSVSKLLHLMGELLFHTTGLKIKQQ